MNDAHYGISNLFLNNALFLRDLDGSEITYLQSDAS